MIQKRKPKNLFQLDNRCILLLLTLVRLFNNFRHGTFCSWDHFHSISESGDTGNKWVLESSHAGSKVLPGPQRGLLWRQEQLLWVSFEYHSWSKHRQLASHQVAQSVARKAGKGEQSKAALFWQAALWLKPRFFFC